MTASGGDELGSIPALTEQLGLSQAQVNGLLPAHDAYVKAFREIIEDDFADFVEEDENDGKYQWASADSELAASFRSRRSKYRNLCDELEEAEDEPLIWPTPTSPKAAFAT